MTRHISEELRKAVAIRANYCCEYCLIQEEDTFFTCQIDHIISLKHGGLTTPDNLAYSCIFCNRNKGSDIGSIILPADKLIRFFNPRKDIWKKHFQLKGFIISPITDIGKVTVKIFKFNKIERQLEREALIAVKRYPPTSY